MEIVIDDLRAGYVKVCQMVRYSGDEVEVRGLRTTELTGVTLVCEQPRACMLPIKVERGVNLELAAVEALCLIGGVWRQDLVTLAAPAYAKVLVDQADESAAYGAYGPRVRGQLATVVDQLAEDPSTRQALLSIWRPDDLTHRGDKPCTIVIQFLLRRHALECHVFMRSNDVWLGLAMDAFVFTQLQRTVAHALGVNAGKYVHHVGSLHAYERDWAKIERLVVRPLPAQVIVLPDGVRSPQPVKAAQAILDGRLAPADPWYVYQVNKLRDRAALANDGDGVVDAVLPI